MDRHRRIARTLFCLVASMTLGAAVLDWVQPTYQPRHKQSHQLVALLKNAINQPIEGTNIQNQWHEIQIHIKSATAASGTDHPHFLIDGKGNMTATENWRLQKQAQQPGIISVGILSLANSREMTGPQWNTAQKLVLGLQQLCDIPTSRIIWAKAPDLSASRTQSHPVRPIATSVR